MPTLQQFLDAADAADEVLQAARRSRKGWASGPGRIVRADGLVEATRYYRTEGAAFSGWIVRSVLGPPTNGSDPIPTKQAAVTALLSWKA